VLVFLYPFVANCILLWKQYILPPSVRRGLRVRRRWQLEYSEVYLPEAIPRQWKGSVELDSFALLPEDSLLAQTADFLCLLHMLFLYLFLALQVHLLFVPSDMQFISVGVLEKQMCKPGSCLLVGESRQMLAQAYKNLGLKFGLG